MLRDDHRRIAPTAHYTAYAWHRLRLPYAELFATRTGWLLYWMFFLGGEWTTRLRRNAPTMLRYLEYRHRILDAIVADHRPDCLIEVGAGLSRRPVTWVLDHDVRAIEIDLAALAGVKRAAIERAPSILRERLADRHRIITDDLLAPGFADRLREAIGDAVRPIVVTEGVLSYFSAADRHAAVSAIADGLSGFPHGAFVSEFHTQSRRRQLGNGPVGMRWAIRMLTRRKQALDGYADIEAVHAALARAGFGTSRTVERLEYTLPEHLERMRSPLSFVVAYSRSRSHTRSSNDDR